MIDPLSKTIKLDDENKEVTNYESRLLLTQQTLGIKYGKYISHSISGTQAQTAGNYGVFFIVRHPIEILRISEVHSVAGTDAGAVTLDVKYASDGTAIGSGTSLLSSEFDLKSTANTVVYKEGVNLSSNRKLKEGDRIGLVTTGTLTNLEDVCITIYYNEINQGYTR